MRRVTIDAPHSAPCRVTLQDAAPGEQVLLLPFAHHMAHSPYRASGPIFVREGGEAFDRVGELPPVFGGRRHSEHLGYIVGDPLGNARLQ